MTEEQIRQIIRDELYSFMMNDKFVFNRNLNILDARNIILGGTAGTQIGTASTQKLGFYGATPVDQPATVNDPSGGVTVDSAARTAIEALIDRLQELGLIA